MALPAFTFDTHKFVCKLKGAGFNDQQAEALTDAVQESQASLNVATKQDVVDVRRDMDKALLMCAAKSAICARTWTPSLRAWMPSSRAQMPSSRAWNNASIPNLIERYPVCGKKCLT